MPTRARGLRRRLPERLTLVVLDVAAFAVGLRAAYALHLNTAVNGDPFAASAPFEALGPLLAIQVVVMLAVFFLHQLYHLPRGVSRVDALGRVFRAVSIGVVLTYA